jgi:hypothetical protein
MGKQSGLGDQLYVSGYDLSGDVGSLSRIAGGNSPLTMTGINKSAVERIGGKRDGGMQFEAYFNPTGAHPVLSALPTADRLVTYFRGEGLGNPAASVLAKQITYDGSRGDDGSYTLDVAAEASGFGLEWGRQMTAGRRVDTGATNGASVQAAAGATSFGLQAYLHVVAFTGTDCTITIEESSDDGGGDAFAAITGGAFTQVTAAPFSERIVTANDQAVEEYLRVVTAGTFTSIDFIVMIIRNETEIVF